MQIDAISKIAPSATQWARASHLPKPEASTNSTTGPGLAPASSSRSLASAQAPPSAAQALDSASAVQVVAIKGALSTTVAGKNYSLSIEQAGATYVASVPDPPGATATGSSAQVAENNLDIKLDTLA
jgi:hypothetical protein